MSTYDDLKYYKEKLNIIFPHSEKKEILFEQGFNRNLFKHYYSEEQINEIKQKLNFQPMRELLVEYYIEHKFISSSASNRDLPLELKKLLENENNLYFYNEEHCDYALLIIDVDNNNLYNFYHTCRG